MDEPPFSLFVDGVKRNLSLHRPSQTTYARKLTLDQDVAVLSCLFGHDGNSYLTVLGSMGNRGNTTAYWSLLLDRHTIVDVMQTKLGLDTSEGIHGYAPLFAAALCDPRTVATKKMEEETLPVPTSHPKLILTLHFDIGDEAFIANVELNLVHKDLSSLMLESQLGLLSSMGQSDLLTDQDNNENRGIISVAAASSSSSSASSSSDSAVGKRNRDTYESHGILSPSSKGTTTTATATSATSASAIQGSTAGEDSQSIVRGSGVGVVVKPTSHAGRGRGGGGLSLFPRR